MKRSISILLCLALIFSSFSFAFADDWGSSQITSVVNNVSSINTTLSNIYTRVNSITNYLYDDGHSVAYWTSAIASWMSPIYTALTSGMQANLGLDTIINMLAIPTTVQGGGTTYTSRITNLLDLKYGYIGLNDNNPSGAGSWITLYGLNGDGSMSGYGLFARNSNLIGIMPYYLRLITNNSAIMGNIMNTELKHIDLDYNAQQHVVNWGNLGTSYFTPSSTTNGIYSYLSAIQAPVARLSYVLASEERIEAQELAAANEQAVVDNFIDSTGDGSVPTSSFSDVSGLSSGVSSNLSTDASPSQIWDIFNSDHGSWFSQETANQLDTTTRTRGSEFETPLLDQQMEEIYKSLGGGK